MNNSSEGHTADLLQILKTRSLYDDDFECKYIDMDIIGRLTNDKFSIFSQNVRSLGGKFDLIREYVGRCDSKITCIALQEVWSIGRKYDLPGYHQEYNDCDKEKNINPKFWWWSRILHQ